MSEYITEDTKNSSYDFDEENSNKENSHEKINYRTYFVFIFLMSQWIHPYILRKKNYHI